MKDFQSNNPLLFLIILIGIGVVTVGKYITPGTSMRKRRQLAKARAAKKRKRTRK